MVYKCTLFYKFNSKTCFIGSRGGGTNLTSINLQYFFCMFLFWILSRLPSFAWLLFDILCRFWRHSETCLFLCVCRHSDTQTPLSHCARSSDWAETRCFRSRVPQMQTHSWPRWKSNFWCFSTKHTATHTKTECGCWCAVYVLFLPHQAGDCGAAAVQHLWPGEERVCHRQCYPDPPHLVWDQETSVGFVASATFSIIFPTEAT